MYHFTIPPRTTQSRLASRNLANQSSGFSQQPHTHVPSPPLSFQIEIVFWSCAKHKKWRITIEAIFFYRFFHLIAHVLALFFRSSSSERKTIFTISKFFNIKNNLSLLSSPSSSFALANSKYVFARCFAWSPPAAAQLSHSVCSSEKSFEKRRVKISLQMSESDIPSIIFEEFLSCVCSNPSELNNFLLLLLSLKYLSISNIVAAPPRHTTMRLLKRSNENRRIPFCSSYFETISNFSIYVFLCSCASFDTVETKQTTDSSFNVIILSPSPFPRRTNEKLTTEKL